MPGRLVFPALKADAEDDGDGDGDGKERHGIPGRYYGCGAGLSELNPPRVLR